MRIAYCVPSYRRPVIEIVGTILQDYTYCIREDHHFRWFWLDAQPVDRARNIAVKMAREAGCDRLMMLDCDVYADPLGSPLEQLMDTMEQEQATAVSAAVVCRRGDVVNVDPVRPHERYRCEKVGGAMLLLDLRALDTLAPDHTWFRYVTGPDGITVEAGEDLYFSQEVTRLGGTLIANFQIPTRHSVVVPLALERYSVSRTANALGGADRNGTDEERDVN